MISRSKTRSHTFPNMSYKPNWLGAFCDTLCNSSLLFSANQADSCISVGFLSFSIIVPFAANNHSLSVGSLKYLPVISFSFFINSKQSSYVMPTIGFSSPISFFVCSPKTERHPQSEDLYSNSPIFRSLFPITAFHNSCVTVVWPI